jgi:hypothetical protein
VTTVASAYGWYTGTTCHARGTLAPCGMRVVPWYWVACGWYTGTYHMACRRYTGTSWCHAGAREGGTCVDVYSTMQQGGGLQLGARVNVSTLLHRPSGLRARGRAAPAACIGGRCGVSSSWASCTAALLLPSGRPRQGCSPSYLPPWPPSEGAGWRRRAIVQQQPKAASFTVDRARLPPNHLDHGEGGNPTDLPSMTYPAAQRESWTLAGCA